MPLIVSGSEPDPAAATSGERLAPGPGRPRRLALVCSAHGLGHLTRQLALARALIQEGASPVIFTARPAFARASDPTLEVVDWAVDVGIAQRDSLREDLPATLALLEERCAEPAIDALAAALAGFDRLVVDIAPVALEAARRAGVPALAMGNFDWAWIYRHYPALAPWAARFAAWQASHPALRLEPGPGLSGFASVAAGGLLGRRAPAWTFPDADRRVLVGFGGAGLPALLDLLPRIPGVRWVLAPPLSGGERADVERVEAPFPALVAGVDLVFSKPGYSVFAECALAGTPLVWVPRPDFPEAPWLERAMAARGDRAVRASPDDPDAFRPALAEAILERLAAPRPAPVESNEAARLARLLCEGVL